MESDPSQVAPVTASGPMPAPPLPVQTLDYSPPPRSGRPGILTAVGVMSIVIGALSTLMGCSSVVTMVMMQLMRRAAPGPGAATAPASAAAFAMWPLDLPSLVLSGFDAILRLALALLLIAAGILVLRDHQVSRRLHVLWAWVKIPAALLGAVVYWRQMSGMFAAMPTTPGSPVTPQYMSMMMLVGGLVQAGIACAYPIGVLIVMKTRTVRDYYDSELGATRGM